METGGHLPLSTGSSAKHSVSVDDDFLFPVCDDPVYSLYHILHLEPGAYVAGDGIRFSTKDIIEAYFVPVFICAYRKIYGDLG